MRDVIGVLLCLTSIDTATIRFQGEKRTVQESSRVALAR